jgi:hypothetical protein
MKLYLYDRSGKIKRALVIIEGVFLLTYMNFVIERSLP